MYRIRRTEDVDEARDAHAMAFPGEPWVGDDHEFWLAKDARGDVVGFCSAKYFSATRTVFLSRAAVVLSASGAGLQRRMIRVRLAWARKLGAVTIVTYTAVHNHPSMVNLIRCGFRLEEPVHEERGKYHVFYLGARPQDSAFKQMS